MDDDLGLGPNRFVCMDTLQPGARSVAKNPTKLVKGQDLVVQEPFLFYQRFGSF